MIGRVLDGRYRVGPRIARGGMATVYEATDLRLDRVCALKIMHTGLGDDEEFAARFVREARHAARLSHPNVVGVFDQGRIQTKPFKLLKEGPCLTRQFVRTRGNQGADGFLGLANRGFEVSEKLLSVRGDRQHAPARQLFAPKLIDRPENDY